MYHKWSITYGREYKVVNNQLNTLIKNVQEKYQHKKFTDSLGNPKEIWKSINQVIGKVRNNAKNNEFEIENTLVSDPMIIANKFNDFFTSIGGDLSMNHVDVPNFEMYLPRVQNNVSFTVTPVSEEEIQNILSCLKDKAAGYDDLPAFIFRENSHIFSNILCRLCNLSMQTGKFPEKLKLAKVTCLFKAGDPKLLGNYRPLSVLPTISKLLERIMHTRLTFYLKENNFLSDEQYGFRERHTTEDALNNTVTSMYQGFESGFYGLGTFIDLAKAFDSIDKDILIRKLEFYGVKSIQLEWFKSYFDSRKQYTAYQSASSEVSGLEYGVIQGSILGPLLFNVYMNDITNACNEVKIVMYADDTNVFCMSKSLNSLYSIMNKELNNLQKWFSANKLTLNISKTKYILFHRRQKVIDQPLPNLKIYGMIIEKVPVIKFLGIFIDEHLEWKQHLQYVTDKISKYVPLFYRIRKSVPLTCMKVMYFSFIYSNLIYCNTVWCSVNKTTINKLIIAQKKIIRAISGTPSREPSSPLFENLQLLKVENILIFFRCLYVFKSLNNMNSFVGFERPAPAQYHTRQSERNTLVVPNYRTDHSRQSILFTGTAAWNDLPESIKSSQSSNSFKYQLKRFMLLQ